MAKKFKSFETRDKPRKRGPRQHKKNKNKNEKRQQKQKLNYTNHRLVILNPLL